jgi:hypothetical protein
MMVVKRKGRRGRTGSVTTCHRCGRTREAAGPVGRTEACDGCGADLHVCRNCEFYDPAAYNECRESRAERVLEKDRSNFCDWFRGRAGTHPKGKDDRQEAARKGLDDLFRKP